MDWLPQRVMRGSSLYVLCMNGVGAMRTDNKYTTMLNGVGTVINDLIAVLYTLNAFN